MRKGTLKNMSGALDGARVQIMSARTVEEDAAPVVTVRLLEDRGAYKTGDMIDVAKYEVTYD